MTPTDAYAPEYPADCGPDERIGYVYVDGAECTPDEADNIGLHDLASAARSFASLRPDFYTVAAIESVGYSLAVECYEVGAADGYQVRSIPGGPSHLVRPIVLTGATWVEAMNWCRDRVTADIAAETAP
jgi:hypothetical protein